MPGAISSIGGKGNDPSPARCVSVLAMAGSQATRPRVPLRALVVLIVLVGAGVVLTLVLSGGGKRDLVPGAGNKSGTFDPLGYTPRREPRLPPAAAAGARHIVSRQRPGGRSGTP